MKRFTAIFAAIVALFAVSAVSAQDDHHKVEFAGTYSHHWTDTGLDDIDPDFDSRVGSPGFNVSLTGNVSRYVGIKGDFSFNNKSWEFADGGNSIDASYRTTQFMGGVQFKDNNRDGSRVRPFAHVLAGLANQRLGYTERSGGTVVDSGSLSTNNFAMALGGGVDVKASDRVSIRVFQFDYNPVFQRDETTTFGTFQGQTQNNFRIGFGIVIH